MISLLHTGSQDTAETQDEEEVVQEDLIVLQSNLLMSPPGQSHFATEVTLEEDGYDSDNKINPMNTIINKDSMEDDNAALVENLNQIRSDRRTVELRFSWECVLSHTWISPWHSKKVYYVKRITRKRSLTYVLMDGEISV